MQIFAKQREYLHIFFSIFLSHTFFSYLCRRIYSRQMGDMMTKSARWRMPAEWEPQSGVQLIWPHADTDWAPILHEIRSTYIEMGKAIAERERLLLITPKDGENCHFANSQYLTLDSNDTWARDNGFITLVDDEGHYRLLDFCFNGWGEKFSADKDNALNRQIFDAGFVVGAYTDENEFVLEGGSIESDGKGTIFTTAGCLMAPHRNQPFSQQEIEEYLKKHLAADRVVWIHHGHLTGDDTDGHIDTLVRVAPDDTLIYVGCDNPDDEQYEDLLLMEQELQSLRTQDGKPYRLLRLSMPRAIFDEGQRLPATYANFLIINGAVLYPTYCQPELDAEAERIIQQAFPDREMVGVDCCSIIKQHGSLHCCTMQFPKGVLKEIDDKPW